VAFPRPADASLLVYRQFDVADEIRLDVAERLLRGTAERLRLKGERAGFLDLPERPLRVLVDVEPVAVEGTTLPGVALVRLFAHGVASVRYEIPLPAGADAATLAAVVRSVADADAITDAARRTADAVVDGLAEAMDARHSDETYETYTVVFVRDLGEGATVADVSGMDLARILLGEPLDVRLSEGTVQEVTRERFSYAADDLCVIDWDTAFLVEPSGDRSVADVLELVSAQLLELRYYDALTERQLLSITDMLGRRPFVAGFQPGRFAAIARRVQGMVVETAEFVERVENALRVVGDMHLARLYRAAVERFRLRAWQADIARRQQTAAQVSGLLWSETTTRLGHVLEATIVALIVLEVAMALL
jgi:hypothetical protein